MSPDGMDASTIHVQLLSTEGCKFCDEARALFERLRNEYPLDLVVMDVESEFGQELALRHGVLFPPGIFIEGEFLQYGRPSERKVRARLAELQARPGAARRHAGSPG